MTKRVVLLGAGRVAFHLAKQLVKVQDFELIQVFSRRLTSAEDLISSIDFSSKVKAVDELSSVNTEADYYIFSLVDSALEEVWSQMPQTKGLWLHTAGSVSIEQMARYHQHSAVLYPLQTFSKERELDWAKIPLYLETLDNSEMELETLALAFSQNTHWVSSKQRAKLHCAAVFACNFTNHMLALSEELLQKESFEAKTLLPLIDETLAKVHYLPAKQAQTGPAIRGDENTMNAHLEALADSPHLAKLYKLLSQSIQDF